MDFHACQIWSQVCFKESIKGRAIIEFLADQAVKTDDAKEFSFHDENLMTIIQDTWKVYFNATSN